MKIYLDMDGVLCDFWGKVYEFFPDFKIKEPKTEVLWEAILSIPNFWEGLKPLPDYRKLVDLCIELVGKENVYILSAGSRFDERAIPGKKKWLKHWLSDIDESKFNFVPRKFKKDFANSDSLLIDDFAKNVKDFIKSGGKALLYTNYNDTKQQLKNLL